MTTPEPENPAQKTPDWVQIEADYRAGVKPLRQIADEHGISHVAISKRAKKNDWTRDLAGKIKGRAVPITEVADDSAKAGFVYVIYFEANGGRHHKIGMATNPQERLKSHQCSVPFDLRVAVCYFVGNMRAEERHLHELFAAKRVRGEWFDLNDDDLRAIAQRSFLND